MLAWMFPTVARLPIQLVFSIVYLIYYFGYSLLGAFGIAIVIIIINFILAVIGQKIQKVVLARKDERMRFTTELINNIKIIKLNSWAYYFIDKLSGARGREIQSYRWGFYMMGVNIAIMFLLGPLLIMSTYGIFFSTGHTITVAKGFAALQVLNSLNMPLRWIPGFIGSLLQFTVSMRRIEKFLLTDEIHLSIVQDKSPEANNRDLDILIENAYFSWGGKKSEETKKGAKGKEKDKPLKDTGRSESISSEKSEKKNAKYGINEEGESDSESNEESKASTASDSELSDDPKNIRVMESIQITDLNLQIHKGEFICVIGAVGSGKSSLIHALLGDMIYMNKEMIDEYKDSYMNDEVRHEIIERSRNYSSKVKLGGTVSYVQQIPWIQNKTIRDNILFNLPMDEDKYNKTIEL